MDSGGGGFDNNPMMRKSQLKQKSSVNDSSGENYDNDDYKKKMLHRDLERLRRQEMATLYASLRTLLPLEYIKGYRAVSDHMNGAVNYIKDLKQRVEGLRATRDELKKLSESSVGFDSEINSSSSYFSPSCVMVNPCPCGVEVVISTHLRVQGLPLSRALQVILDQGLNVVSCVSTRLNETLVYKMQVEVNELTGFDTCWLQQKLIAEEVRLWNETSK